MAPGMDLFRFDPPDPPDGAVRQFAHDLYGVTGATTRLPRRALAQHALHHARRRGLRAPHRQRQRTGGSDRLSRPGARPHRARRPGAADPSHAGHAQRPARAEYRARRPHPPCPPGDLPARHHLQRRPDRVAAEPVGDRRVARRRRRCTHGLRPSGSVGFHAVGHRQRARRRRLPQPSAPGRSARVDRVRPTADRARDRDDGASATPGRPQRRPRRQPDPLRRVVRSRHRADRLRRHGAHGHRCRRRRLGRQSGAAPSRSRGRARRTRLGLSLATPARGRRGRGHPRARLGEAGPQHAARRVPARQRAAPCVARRRRAAAHARRARGWLDIDPERAAAAIAEGL